MPAVSPRYILILLVTLICGTVIGLDYWVQGVLRQSQPLPVTAASDAEGEAASVFGEIYEKTVPLLSGGTLSQLLQAEDISPDEIQKAVEAVNSRFDVKRLRVGQNIFIRCLAKKDDYHSLLRLQFRPSLDCEIVVTRQEDGCFESALIERPLVEEVRVEKGVIQSSLFGDSARLNIPHQVIAEMAHGLSFDLHLQKDLQQGDPFEVMYSAYTDKESGDQKAGNLLYASMHVQGATYRIYRYEGEDEHSDLYNQHGESIRKALLVTPVSAARLSSTFGNRRHPVLGYTRMHRGVDFAAPKGTPVMAAGDGTVVFVGHKRGYGNYIMLDHRNGMKTVYAHLSKFARSLRVGKSVRQGEVIGAVGMTGMATGPHLHHEVHINGEAVNPLKLRHPPRKKLTGSELSRFMRFKEGVDKKIQSAQCSKDALKDQVVLLEEKPGL